MKRVMQRLAWSVLLLPTVLVLPDAVAQQVKGPILRIETDPLNFDTTFCQTTKCRSITFRNIGDTLLQVYSVDALTAPFIGAIPPFSLGPSQSRTFDLCYRPMSAPTIDSQRVGLRADSRVSLSVALLFDSSASMQTLISPGITRAQAAKDAATDFIDGLLATTDIQDEAGVFSFAVPSSYTVSQTFTTDKLLLKAAVPSVGGGTGTCIYDALMKTIDRVKLRAKNRVIIVLTDGDDSGTGICGPTLPADVIAAAVAAKVTIFTIGIGSANPAVLTQIATGSGGQHFTATTNTDLIGVYRSIATRLSNNISLSFLLRGQGVSPVIAVTPSLVDFYSVKVGSSACQPVVITNNGNAPLSIPFIAGILAPFTMQNPPSAAIPPGGSASFNVCFTPTQLGFQQTNGNVQHNACGQASMPLTLRGVGYSTSAMVLGPILEIAPSPLDFDTTFCLTTKCRDLAFTNLGDTALTVRTMPAIPAPFTGTIPVPFTLNPAQTRFFRMCYRPPTAPSTDEFIANLQADTRVSLSIGLLFDVSGSMTLGVSGSDGTPRINAARNAGNVFITSLIDTLSITDEASVMTFSDNFVETQQFTSDKTLLHAAVTAIAPMGLTRLYASTQDAVNAVKIRTNHRVVIVLTDGDDNIGGASPASIIAAATEAGKEVTVFTIGIGEANAAPLQQIATGTGGQFFSAATTTDLIGVYRQIASLLSKNSKASFTMRGRGVTPVMQLSSNMLFDSVKVGKPKCIPYLIRNIGEAPLDVTGWTNGNPEFTVTSLPAQIAPGTNGSVTVCFNPAYLRLRRDTIYFQHNGCSQPDVPLVATGIGWDSVTISLQGSYVAKPGSSVEIPVRLLDTLPAKYDVTSYMLTVAYNKTLLASNRATIDPEAPAFKVANTLSSIFPGPAYAETTLGGEGRTTYTLAGATLSNPKADSVLLRLNFLALLGNNRSTNVTVAGVQFADGNPRVGIVQPAKFTIDSLCFIDKRLLDPTSRIAATLRQNVPNPFNQTTRLSFTVHREGRARLTVVDAHGREAALLIDEWKGEGEYDVVFDASSLPAGIYLARLECGGWSDVKKMVLVK